MRLIKEKVRFRGNDIQLKLNLTSNSNLNGLQESINDFIENETGLSINPVNDIDTFRYISLLTTNYDFQFFSGGSYSTSYEFAGFTTGETATREEVISRSFFLMQVYDVPQTENQVLLHSGYFNGFSFLSNELEGNPTNAEYLLTSDTEFTNLYISNKFIESLSGITTTLYARMYFYNAKTGKLQLFYNEDNDPPETDEDIYVEILLNPNTKKYGLTNSVFKEFNNQDYINKINDTLDSFDNQKPTFPTGNTFLNTGKYIQD